MRGVNLTLGTPVVAQGNLAIVRYFGATEFKPGVWVGVEFVEPGMY